MKNIYLKRLQKGEAPEPIMKDIFTYLRTCIAAEKASPKSVTLPIQELEAILEIVEISDDPVPSIDDGSLS